MTIYELYGRMSEERHLEHAQHMRTIALLRDVVTGTIAADRVQVGPDTWTVRPEGAQSNVVPLRAVGGEG